MRILLALVLLVWLAGCGGKKILPADYSPEGKKTSEMSCVYRTKQGAQLEPLSSRAGQGWLARSLVSLSPEVESWRKVWQTARGTDVARVLKKQICSVRTPSLSQTFNVDLPATPPNTTYNDLSQTRKLLAQLIQATLKSYYSSQSIDPRSDLSCYEGKMTSGLSQIVKGSHYEPIMDYSKLADFNSIYVVRLEGDDELHIVFGPLAVGDMFNPEKWGTLAGDQVTLYDDKGPLEHRKRALNLIRLWEIEILSHYYAFVRQGRTNAQALRARADDWKTYLQQYTEVQAVDLLSEESVHFRAVLYLSGFCQYAQPVADLMPH